MDEDNLLVEEIQTQIDVAKALVHKLEAEIRDTVENLEVQATAAEIRRLRAERAAASLQREQGQMVQAGRKHAALIVKWWMGGLGLAWLLSMVISVLISPVLGFVVVIPIIALFLLFGYASSNVEMKVDIAALKREKRDQGRRGSAGSIEMETEEFIGQLLGQSPEEIYARTHTHHQRGRTQSMGGGGGGGGIGSGLLSVVKGTGSVIYGIGAGTIGVTKWMLGYGGGGGRGVDDDYHHHHGKTE